MPRLQTRLRLTKEEKERYRYTPSITLKDMQDSWAHPWKYNLEAMARYLGRRNLRLPHRIARCKDCATMSRLREEYNERKRG